MLQFKLGNAIADLPFIFYRKNTSGSVILLIDNTNINYKILGLTSVEVKSSPYGIEFNLETAQSGLAEVIFSCGIFDSGEPYNVTFS